jgi:hypothetical protein
MILNESQLFGFFNHLLSNMFRKYVESHHQAFLNNSLKIIKDIKRIILNNIGTDIKFEIKLTD